MTERTSQKLADALRGAGLEELAKRAELDEFHDFKSPHDLPELYLDMELLAAIKANPSNRKIAKIRGRLHLGDFDADKTESDAWAASPEGQETLGLLVRRK